MSPSRVTSLVSCLLLATLLASVPRESWARTPDGRGRGSSRQLPAAVLPIAGDRVSESDARFVVSTGSGARDVRIVVARFRFDPTSWKDVPAGPSWTIAPCTGSPVPLEPLGLVDPVETRLWWAVVWVDERTGVLRAGDVRELTVVPRFSNRVGATGALRPATSGQIVGGPVAVGAQAAPRRSIALSAGYTLVPGGPAPRVPDVLKREPVAPKGAAPGHLAYIVQFADDAPDAARSRIAAAGGVVVWPLSGDGFLVRMDAVSEARLGTSDGQPWIAAYEPAYKLSPALDPTAAGIADVTALLFPDVNGDATLAALRALGATQLDAHRGPLNHVVRFRLDRTRLADAAALVDVAWMEPTPEFTFQNDQAQWVVQTGVPNSRTVTSHGLRGQDQIVMTCDSGIRTNHEMFNDSTQAITTWGDYPNHRKVVAYKRGSDSPAIGFGDEVAFEYHGTHTAGTVAGNPHPFSTAPWSGVAEDSRLYFMDVAGPGGGGLNLPSDLNDLFQPSYTGNAAGAARISSNSWGSSGQLGYYTISSMQTDQFVWAHPDYLIAFASGNVGVFGSVNSPGTAKNTLTVGASGNGVLQNTLASFSSRGPSRDGRRKPTVVAPGDLVTSSIGSTRYTYATYSGTSMATPAVAGAMALVRQYLTDGWYPTGAPVPANRFTPSAALLRAMAVAAARNDVVSFRAPDNSIGYGRLTIDDVLYFPGDSSRTLLVDTKDGLTDRQYVEYEVQVTDPSRPLKVALCWTDAPGNPASVVQIVNDLDLVVTHDGVSYRGNYLLNNISLPADVRDSLNVEEFVRLPAPAAGVWTVRVEGRRVVQGPQTYALCITGGVGGPAGAIALDRFEYGLRDTLAIEVIDTNAPGPLTVQVTSGTEQWNEPVTLTGANGVFRGSLPIAPTTPRLTDGVLSVSSGDRVTVTYADGPGARVAASARVNVQVATISDVHAVATGGSQAEVTWTTDLPADSRVRYGPTAALGSTAVAGDYAQAHRVLLTGLQPGTTYLYDVESATLGGDVSRDSLAGTHRSFTTRSAGSIALLMDDPDTEVLAAWRNAIDALGWDVDVFPPAANDPPLVGNSAAGLRRYDAVLWQVGPDNYPPFSDAQRTAIDSLLDGGGRLLVTGHDIGFGLSDAGCPSYSLEREEWIESGLKTRYYLDNFYASGLRGVAGNPVSGAYTDSVSYAWWLYPDSGDNVGPAPGTDGVWTGDWIDNFIGSQYMGMHWESNAPRGTPGVGVWGGEKSRLVGMFYEWSVVDGGTVTHHPDRTGVLHDAASYLLGHQPPEVLIVSPAPGVVLTDAFLPIRFSVRPDAGRTIAGRWLDYSLDGGETWKPITTAACTDSGCIWDLAAALGGSPTANSLRAMLRVRVTDDGTPALTSTATMSGTFTLARAGGDTRGPVLLAGSASCTPIPVRTGRPTTLLATFSDAETGGSAVAAAEFSTGASAAPAGAGIAMVGTFGGTSAQASAAVPTANLPTGDLHLWVRGRDTAGNWGPAARLSVPAIGTGTVSADEVASIDFLATPSPSPFRGLTTVRFGLARSGPVQLDLFDVTGRRVRTLARGTMEPGPHVATWDGRDQHGQAVGAGVYFVRLTTPAKTFHSRVVSLR